MEEITITRSGQKDLVFTGERLATANNKWIAGRDQTRWHELTLYRTASGKYVLQTEYITRWQGELGNSSAVVCDTAQDVLGELEGEDGGLSDLSKDLLQEAAKSDPAFAGIWTERLE